MFRQCTEVLSGCFREVGIDLRGSLILKVDGFSSRTFGVDARVGEMRNLQDFFCNRNLMIYVWTIIMI